MQIIPVTLGLVAVSVVLISVDKKMNDIQVEQNKQLFVRDFYAGFNKIINRRHIPVLGGYHSGTKFCIVDDLDLPLVDQLATSLQALFSSLELDTTVEQHTKLEDCSTDATKYIQVASSYDPERSDTITAAEHFFYDIRGYIPHDDAIRFREGSGGHNSNYVDPSNANPVFSIAFVDWTSLQDLHPEHAERMFHNTFLEESLHALTTIADINWYGQTNTMAQESGDYYQPSEHNLDDWLGTDIAAEDDLERNAQGFCFTDLLFLLVIEDLGPHRVRMSDALAMIDERYDSYVARAERAYDDEEARFVLDLECR